MWEAGAGAGEGEEGEVSDLGEVADFLLIRCLGFSSETVVVFS